MNAKHHYDLSGRLLAKTTNGLTNETHLYNWNNQTTNILVGGTQYAYKYDVLGRRVWKHEGDFPATDVFFDGDDAYQESTNSWSGIYAEYIFMNEIDEPLTLQRGSTLYTYHQDHLGTVVGLTAEDEDVAARYRYTAYGLDRGSVSTVTQPYTYTARERIGTTDLYFYRSRVYDSRSGRFLRTDDLRDGFNWYAYVEGDPVGRIDPYGHASSAYKKCVKKCKKKYKKGLRRLKRPGCILGCSKLGRRVKNAVTGALIGLVTGGPAGMVAGALIGATVGGAAEVIRDTADSLWPDRRSILGTMDSVLGAIGNIIWSDRESGDKSNGLADYGNYCGNERGGDITDDESWHKGCADHIDSACRRHDYCHGVVSASTIELFGSQAGNIICDRMVAYEIARAPEDDSLARRYKNGVRNLYGGPNSITVKKAKESGKYQEDVEYWCDAVEKKGYRWDIVDSLYPCDDCYSFTLDLMYMTRELCGIINFDREIPHMQVDSRFISTIEVKKSDPSFIMGNKKTSY